MRSPVPDILINWQSIGQLRGGAWKTVPAQPGIYWWYFPQACLASFGISEHCNVSSLRLRSSSASKVCLYVGIATSLRERMKWHAEQPLTQGSLRSGFLSTFRKTLLALKCIDYDTGFETINAFMDGLDVSWQATADLRAAKEMETAELGGTHQFPLNIQGNSDPVLRPYVQFLKRQRKEYVTRYLDNLGTSK